MIMEVIEVEKCPENFIKDGWKISNAWKPIKHQEKEEKEKRSKERKQPTSKKTQHVASIPNKYQSERRI